jgi:hypothetical protein
MSVNTPSLFFREREDALKKRETEHVLKEAAVVQRDREEGERVAKRRELQNKFTEAAAIMSHKVKSQNRRIDDFVTLFYNTHGRRPLTEEIMDYFKDENSIDNDIMINFLKRYTLTDGLGGNNV